MMLSDVPGFSVTRVCADDFGIALKVFKTLRTHASIFNLARQVAGLHLKPTKCVLVVSCVTLTEELKFAIRNWLHTNVPEFEDFDIQPSGKYLGWILGADSCRLSYKDPVKKFRLRTEEVFSGGASATASLVRYNQGRLQT